jgi:hypothetical protein
VTKKAPGVAPDRHRGSWWQRFRRAAAGLGSRMAAPVDAVAVLVNGDPAYWISWLAATA